MRKRGFELALCCLALSACETTEDVANRPKTAALSDGVQVICEGDGFCNVHDTAVKVVNANGAFCSGTLIGSSRILTSAKCLSDNNFNPAKVCVTNRAKDSRCNIAAPVSDIFYMRAVYVHPSLTGAVGTGSDAAVVQLDREVTPFSNSRGTITPLLIDDQVFGDGFQGTDFGFGTDTANPSISGQKQVRSDIPSVASSFPAYIATRSTTFLAGDFGGGFISASNQVAGINSFVQNGTSFMTRTQPIRAWINNPSSSITSCNILSYKRIFSTMAGKCLEAAGTSVSLKFCECKDSQLWLTNAGQGLTNRATNGSLTAQAIGSQPILTFGPVTAPNQMWLIVGGGQLTQLTANSGPTLTTSTMNTAVMGSTTTFARWWQLK